jgi:hypothetical protein
VATQLAEFKKSNPDCNYSVMSKELFDFLRDVAQADGFWDEREEMAVERVENIFSDVCKFSVSRAAKKSLGAVVEARKK